MGDEKKVPKSCQKLRTNVSRARSEPTDKTILRKPGAMRRAGGKGTNAKVIMQTVDSCLNQV